MGWGAGGPVGTGLDCRYHCQVARQVAIQRAGQLIDEEEDGSVLFEEGKESGLLNAKCCVDLKIHLCDVSPKIVVPCVRRMLR